MAVVKTTRGPRAVRREHDDGSVEVKPIVTLKGDLISYPGQRPVKEWRGLSPESQPPAYVRQRVLEGHGRKCYLSGVPIRDGMDWEIEHVKAIIEGGENVESNMRPALVGPHKKKTAAEKKRRAKADAAARRTTGLRSGPRKKIESRGFEPPPEKPSKAGGKSDLSHLGPSEIERRFK